VVDAGDLHIVIRTQSVRLIDHRADRAAGTVGIVEHIPDSHPTHDINRDKPEPLAMVMLRWATHRRPRGRRLCF
jgi:hypothetical protein